MPWLTLPTGLPSEALCPLSWGPDPRQSGMDDFMKVNSPFIDESEGRNSCPGSQSCVIRAPETTPGLPVNPPPPRFCGGGGGGGVLPLCWEAYESSSHMGTCFFVRSLLPGRSSVFGGPQTWPVPGAEGHSMALGK